MSRRRRASRVSCVVILLLTGAVLVLGAVLWRIYPEYQRLRREQSAAPTPPPSPAAQPHPRPVVARLYFARITEGQQRLVAISRELPNGLTPARAAVEELLRGEVPRGCDRPLPQGTALRGIHIADGVATVDFSRQLDEEFRGGSDNEGVTVYAVVNTLDSLPGIDKVRILVEGKAIDTIGGHLDISGPLAFDGELVVPYP
jgi:germination protein M